MKELKKIFSFMGKYQKIYFLSLVAVMLSQFFNIISPMVIQTTVDNILGNEVIKSKYIESIVSSLGGSDYLRNNLWVIGLILVLMTLFRGLFLFLRNMLAASSSEHGVQNMRNQLYDHIQRLPYEYHVKSETGELIQRCTSDVETIKRFLSVQLIEVVGSIFMMFFTIPIIFSLNTKLAIVAIILLPLTFLFAVLFFKKVKSTFTKVDESDAKLSTTLQENLTGVRVVKAFARQEFEYKKFDEKNLELKEDLDRLNSNLAYYWSISDFISMTQVGLVIIYGIYLSYSGQITLGTFVAFISYINMIIWPIRQLGRTITDMGKAFVSVGRIEEILNEPIEVLKVSHEEPKINGNIAFEDVSFSYNGKSDALSNISFSINSGETLAIIGPTGSGKSTLVSILTRLYDYKSGSIKIDGIELNTIDKYWIRKNIGLILQEPFLYARSIKENIKLPKPQIDDDLVFSSAKIASIHNDILTFDKGYDTLVGERGVSLSGGQKQRMAIARTIITDSPIVIFDDSLSAVDTETDISIRNALENRKNKSTTIIISHRISTVSKADKIIVLDKGKVVESGTHAELILQKGIYSRVHEIQNSIDFEKEV